MPKRRVPKQSGQHTERAKGSTRVGLRISGLPLIFLYAVSGFCILSLEMVWTREISLRAGNTVAAAAMVFSIFFIAAAMGNLFGAAAVRRANRPILFYGVFEILAGAAAVATLFGSRWIWRHSDVAPGIFSEPIVMAVIIVGGASFFSGAAFPNLMQAVLVRREDRTVHGGIFYGANLLGAAMGAVIGGVLFPWKYGYQGAFLLTAGLQIFGGLVAVWISGRVPARLKGGAERGESPASGATVWGRGLPFVSGFLSLAAQALLLMWARQILEGSIYAISSVLAVFIGGLGLGSVAASILRRRGIEASVALAGFAAASALLFFLVPEVGAKLILLRVTFPGGDPSTLLWNSLLWSAIWMLPITVCLGGVFPLAWELAFRGSDYEGTVAGTALAINKLGSAFGMLAGCFFVLPVFGLSRGICVVGWGYLLLGILLVCRRWKNARILKWAMVPAIALGCWQVVRERSALGLAPSEKALQVYHGSYGEVSVISNLTTGSRLILLNSQHRLNGTQHAMSTQHHQAWVPLLFCAKPERVMSIGMASGISTAALLDFPLKELDAVELVPEVVRAAREHFQPWNARLFSDSRVRVLTGDGREVLNHARGKFDAIICDLFFPNEEGTANLYSRDFFASALARLNPGGLFCLWLPCYQHDVESSGMIIRTFLDIFPYAIAVRANLDPLQPVIGLIGSAEPLPISRSYLKSKLHEPAAEAIANESPYFRSPENAWLLLAGDLHAADPGFKEYLATTDDRPYFMFSGTSTSAVRPKLKGLAFLNWIGKRFVRPLYPSCDLNGTTPEEVLGSVRAANYYFASAVASRGGPGDNRTEDERIQQAEGYFKKAQDLATQVRLPIDALGR